MTPLNYRPISWFPGVAKVAERLFPTAELVNYNYLDPIDCLSQYHYGFRRGRSIEMALLAMTDALLCGVEKQDFTLLTPIYLSKAFNCVTHVTLLSRLASLRQGRMVRELPIQ